MSTSPCNFGNLNKPINEPLTELEIQVLKVMGMKKMNAPDLDVWDASLIWLMAEAQMGHFARLATAFPELGEVIASFMFGNLQIRYEAQTKEVCEA
jgi:hypothetical protein